MLDKNVLSGKWRAIQKLHYTNQFKLINTYIYKHMDCSDIRYARNANITTVLLTCMMYTYIGTLHIFQ